MNEALKRPMQPNEVEWRISHSRNGKTTLLAYLTNRAVMERFDEAFSPSGWQNTFERWGTNGVKCGLAVLCDNEWVWKYDGADETQVEPTKGGFSDSMKRAAVQWGLGRDLYQYPKVFIDGEHKYIPDWCYPILDKLVEKLNKGEVEKKVILLKDPK